jgi:hypothetical protein
MLRISLVALFAASLATFAIAASTLPLPPSLGTPIPGAPAQTETG